MSGHEHPRTVIPAVAYSTRTTVYLPTVGTYDGAGLGVRFLGGSFVEIANCVEIVGRRSAVVPKRTAGDRTTC